MGGVFMANVLTALSAGMQSVVAALYPPKCALCSEPTEADFGLCPACWRDTRFVEGAICDACGVGLAGEAIGGERHYCDDCLAHARPWLRGRAAYAYAGGGRKLVIALKSGDRTEIARVVAPLMARAARPLLRPETVIVPIPLHWSRRMRRRYNQAALLALALGRQTERQVCPDALVRTRRTPPLDFPDRNERFALLEDAIAANPVRAGEIRQRPVLLVDDVMTSGATFGAATRACYAAGASEVCILALARAAKDA
jgi:ComF family protein